MKDGKLGYELLNSLTHRIVKFVFDAKSCSLPSLGWLRLVVLFEEAMVVFCRLRGFVLFIMTQQLLWSNVTELTTQESDTVK